MPVDHGVGVKQAPTLIYSYLLILLSLLLSFTSSVQVSLKKDHMKENLLKHNFCFHQRYDVV